MIVEVHKPMRCWICGEPGETREHMLKVSDARALFGHRTNKNPLFRRIDNATHEIVQGLKSDKLKFQSPLCGFCNGARTQQHDKSWEALAELLRRREPRIVPGNTVRVAPAFKGGLRRGLLGVHLYFVKLTGCIILDGGVPIDTGPFARVILEQQPHPHLYLSFLAVTSPKLQDQAFVTPLQTISINGSLAGAQWFYLVGRIGVHVTYAPAIQMRSSKVHLWHPRFTNKAITVDGW